MSAIETASTTDKGSSIAKAIVITMRERNVVLPTPDTIERIGLAARAIARRRAEAALISGFSPEHLQSLDDLLKVDPAIAQTRFHWLRSAPDAPGASNLVAMMERLSFIRALDIEPGCRAASIPGAGTR